MIKPGALVMGVVMAAVSAGTYFGLEMLPPGLIPAPIGRVVASEQPAEPTAEPPPQVAAAPAPAPAPEPAAPAEPTEQDLAEEPPPPEAAPVADEPEAAPESAAASTPEPEPAPAPAKAAEAPKPAPKPAPPAEPKTETASAAPATSAPAKKPPEADVLKPWWPTDTSSMPANQLKLMYAGQVKGQGAIALLFSAPLKIDSVKSYASVRNAKGETVGGEWELGKNPKLAVFSGLMPGRYTVILQPQVSDQQGYMLGQTLKGPVYIKED